MAKEYEWGGIVGSLQGLVEDVIKLGAAGVGGTLGAVIGITREAIGWMDLNLGPGGTLGVLAGVAVFALTGGTAVLATVAGVAVGAVVNAMIETRYLNETEKALARQVFGDTLPLDRIILTNLNGLGGRAFTAPGVDGKIYVNLGSKYNNALGMYPDAYPAAGQVLIHELVHAWQIHHATFLPGMICSGIVNQAEHSILGDNAYQYGPAGPAWSSFNLEQQGAIVDQWFGGNGGPTGNLIPGRTPQNPNDPYFGYIANNIRRGVT